MSSNFPLTRLPDVIARDLVRVEEKIVSLSGSETVDRINEVVTHLFEGGGKRIRPVLTLSTANLLGCSGEDHVNLATAVEFVHTATLVHDDVVDESMQRRGRPTANTIWDSKTSVLVGDYLFARSFQLMVAANSIEALMTLADASATISEAEILQLVSHRNLAMGDETYFRIIRGKTAALFSAAARVGAVVSGADSDAIRACEEYGDALGVSFQIMDDLLDYSGATDRLGKNVGDDFRERKVTLPVLRAI
ncbi:MAG: polyprenyl synthetase family protein, partial [Rhodobacteraceae bacterium]|nr:polyprenyl synthetase family protein [Paracoccaceae bacterium]